MLNRIGADGQVEGGVAMGIGMALSEGSQLSDDGRQLNPYLLDYKLQTASDVPSIQVDWVGAPDPNAGPNGVEGGGRAAVRAHAGSGRKRDRQGRRPPVHAAADDAAARVGGDAAMSATYRGRGHPRGGARRHSRAGARPVAGGTDLVVGARQGKAPLPDALVAIHGSPSCTGSRRRPAAAWHRRACEPRGSGQHPVVRARFTALADASAIVGSHATRHIGTIGGNVMNASPAMETGGPLMCMGAEASLASAAGERRCARRALLTGPGSTAARPDELLVAIELPAPAAATGAATPAWNTAARWRSPWSARPAA